MLHNYPGVTQNYAGLSTLVTGTAGMDEKVLRKSRTKGISGIPVKAEYRMRSRFRSFPIVEAAFLMPQSAENKKNSALSEHIP